MRVVRVQQAPFRLDEAERLTAARPDIGALAVFVGRMRDANAGAPVTEMLLDHYPGMTEAALEALAETAQRRWPLLGVMIVHRVGRLTPGEPIVLCAAASAHRDAAFDACRFLMDALKTEAPFWKRETTPDGPRWVEARASDAAARARWDATDV